MSAPPVNCLISGNSRVIQTIGCTKLHIGACMKVRFGTSHICVVQWRWEMQKHKYPHTPTCYNKLKHKLLYTQWQHFLVIGNDGNCMKISPSKVSIQVTLVWTDTWTSVSWFPHKQDQCYTSTQLRAITAAADPCTWYIKNVSLWLTKDESKR